MNSFTKTHTHTHTHIWNIIKRGILNDVLLSSALKCNWTCDIVSIMCLTFIWSVCTTRGTAQVWGMTRVIFTLKFKMKIKKRRRRGRSVFCTLGRCCTTVMQNEFCFCLFFVWKRNKKNTLEDWKWFVCVWCLLLYRFEEIKSSK